jgi:hypothetical protein
MSRRGWHASVLVPLLAVAVTPDPAGAQAESIRDNSFLIEEGYNQEAGVVQHISTFTRASDGSWVYSFTQEWPVVGVRNQVSYTVPLQHGAGTGIGDVMLNYRYQAAGGADGTLALAPRLSLLLPTGNHRSGRGSGGVGWQAAVPVNVQLTPGLATVFNAGLTWIPRARNARDQMAQTTAINLGASGIWALHPRVNLLLEGVWSRGREVVGEGRTTAHSKASVNPGVRWSFNGKSGWQVVPGIAYTIGLGPSRSENALFLYLSVEHPFRRNLQGNSEATRRLPTPASPPAAAPGAAPSPPEARGRVSSRPGQSGG